MTRPVDDEYERRKLRTRPNAELVARLRTTPTPWISDCLKQLDIVNHTLRGVKPLAEFAKYGHHVAGPAFTMEMAPVTGAYPYLEAPYLHTEIVEQGEAGDVLVIAGHGAPYGFFGDHTTLTAVQHGLSTVVIDGYVRDARLIRETGFPVFCTGWTLESYVKRFDAVGYNTTVAVGGAMVRPGDVIVGDDDGVVVIPVEVLERVVQALGQLAEVEALLAEAVAAGKPWREIYPELQRLKYERPADRS